MFTGIVEEVGIVQAIERGPDKVQLRVRAAQLAPSLRPGDSVAVHGACLTVVERSDDAFVVELVPETLRRTKLGELKVGDRVNLEPALPATGRLGGHIVQGHIEGLGRVESRKQEGDALLLEVSVPSALARYIVPKGFIALDGVSLTVIDCERDKFTVTVIPYTQQRTTLAQLAPGDLVNVETDVLARYVERLLSERLPGLEQSRESLGG
jgi:riboflavin synthase